MTTPNPYLSLGEVSPAAEAVTAWGVLNEEQVRDDPYLISWLTADTLVDGSGVYADRGPAGNNGLQATSALQPPVVANADGLGHSAWSFDGASACCIPLNFNLPPGPMTVVAVADIDPSVTTGDGLTHPLVGSMLSTVSNRWALEMNMRQFAMFNRTARQTSAGTHAVSTPHLAMGVLDPIGLQYGVRVNGTNTLYTASANADVNTYIGNSDVTGQIGLGNYAGATKQYKGKVYEVLIFRAPLTNTVHASRLARIEEVLKRKHGITATS